MSELANKKCVPCEKNTSALTPDTAQKLNSEIKGWVLSPDSKNISKTLNFIDFKAALAFINEVGDIAEFEGHHPDINLHNWNKVTIMLSTHNIKGLSENDFIMAAKIDQIVNESGEIK